jgi:hypothetical protein
VVAQNDVFLLRTAFDDVKDPVQAAFFALPKHIRADMLRVDLRRLGGNPDALSGVLLDMGGCTGVD